LYRLFGERPVTNDRTQPTGDVARVPAYTSASLIESDFTAPVQLRPLDAPSTPKGWRAAPLFANLEKSAFGVTLLADSAKPGQQQAIMGILGGVAKSAWRLEPGSTAVLAQQIRDPQAGRFVVKLTVRGDGSDKAFYEDVFQKHFRCRLTLFQFATPAKNPAQRRELASLEIRPVFRAEANSPFEAFELDKMLGNPQLGANFTFGLGIGVAVVVERATDAALDLPAAASAFLSVQQIEVKFEGLTYG
jgi:hypothetical protein